MKKLLLTAIIMLLMTTLGLVNIQAQTYENVLKADSTSWISWHRELEFTMRHVIFVKQTNGINNLYISTSWGNYTDTYFVGTLREDDGRLWITYQDLPNNEYLLMDMNLEVGDEFAFDIYNNNVGTVSEIRYENGRKIIVFDRVSHKWYQENLMFVEGIGRNIIGFLYYDHDQFYQSCKFDGRELAYSTPNTHFRDCEIITDYIAENWGDKQGIEVFPNPAQNTVSIAFPDGAGCQSVEIYALDGRLVQSQNSNCETVDISNLESGVYILKTRMGDSQEFYTKVVKE